MRAAARNLDTPQLADRFDRWACGYDDSALQALLYRPVHAVVLERCARHVPEPRWVLDVGCGTGRLLRDATNRFPRARLVGVDVSRTMLAMASGVCRSLMPVRSRAEALPFADGLFDIATATLTYHHWLDRGTGVAEIGRVLTGGGVFVLATPVAPPDRKRIRRPWRERSVDLPHPLTTTLDRAGLEICDVDHVAGRGPIADVTLIVGVRKPRSCLATRRQRYGG